MMLRLPGAPLRPAHSALPLRYLYHPRESSSESASSCQVGRMGADDRHAVLLLSGRRPESLHWEQKISYDSFL